MSVPTINTKDLTGAALSWAVAQAEGHGCAVIKSTIGLEPYVVIKADILGMYAPHSNPAQGHPIIERENIDIEHYTPHAEPKYCVARMRYPHKGQGPTALIAAMRCHVLNSIGPTVDVPQELLP